MQSRVSPTTTTTTSHTFSDACAWPLVLISADGVCVPAPATVSVTAACRACPFLRDAISSGESVCLVPVARARTLGWLWTYLALASLPQPPSPPSSTPASATASATASVPHAHTAPGPALTDERPVTTPAVDLSDWGEELSLPFRDAWLQAEAEAEAEAQRRARAIYHARTGTRALPSSLPPLPRAPTNAPRPALCEPRWPCVCGGCDVLGDADDLIEAAFPYVLDPLRCGAEDGGAMDVSSLLPRGPPSAPPRGVAQAPASISPLPTTSLTAAAYASADAAHTSAEAYAALLLPLLLAPTGGRSGPTDGPTPPATGSAGHLAGALTPPYDLSEYTPSRLDTSFVRCLVACDDEGNAPASTSTLCAADVDNHMIVPLSLSARQQRCLLELVVLAEWLGFSALYRVCTYTLACWLSQTSVDDLVRAFEVTPRPSAMSATAHSTDKVAAATTSYSRKTVAPLVGPTAGSDRARVRGPAKPAAWTRQTVKSRGDKTDKPDTEKSSPPGTARDETTTDTASANGLRAPQRIQLLMELKQTPSWLLPQPPFPALED